MTSVSQLRRIHFTYDALPPNKALQLTANSRVQSIYGIDECVKVLLYLRGFSFDSPIAILESWRFAS